MNERVQAVVDDQYFARGFFEGLIRMSEKYQLAASFSAAEQAVLRELTRNYTNEEIAARLIISVNTVRIRIQYILEKAGCKNRMALAVNAKAMDLVIHEDDLTENRPQKGGQRT